jgi:hypothetical protein
MTPEYKNNVQQGCSIKEAKDVLGANNFFGPDEWKRYFSGLVFPPVLGRYGHSALFFYGMDKEIPKIPWTKDYLKQTNGLQKRFLFLGISWMRDEPLTFAKWHKELPMAYQQPNLHTLSYYLESEYARDILIPGWNLVTVGPLNESLNKTFQEQRDMAPHRILPSVIETVTAEILYSKLNMKYLDMSHWLRTNDLDYGNGYKRHVCIKGYKDYGISFFMNDDADKEIGILKFGEDC